MTYLEDGEWLSVATNADSYGDMLSMAPPEHEAVIAAPSDNPGIGNTMAREVSTRGNFRITAPYYAYLEDWMLELTGVPRLYDNLQFDALEALFGGHAVEHIHRYHEQFGARRESVGDLLATAAAHGPHTATEALGSFKSYTMRTAPGLNERTKNARKQLLAGARYDSGKLLVARSVLIAD